MKIQKPVFSETLLRKYLAKKRSNVKLRTYQEFVKCDTCTRIQQKLKKDIDDVTLGKVQVQYAGHNQQQREQRMKFWKHNDKSW